MIGIVVAAIVAGLATGFAIARLTDRPRAPETDVEHADFVHTKARELNMALHCARVAGLNPAVTFSPIDTDRAPDERPFRLSVERNGETVLRSDQV